MGKVSKGFTCPELTNNVIRWSFSLQEGKEKFPPKQWGWETLTGAKIGESPFHDDQAAMAAKWATFNLIWCFTMSVRIIIAYYYNHSTVYVHCWVHLFLALFPSLNDEKDDIKVGFEITIDLWHTIQVSSVFQQFNCRLKETWNCQCEVKIFWTHSNALKYARTSLPF